MQLEYLCKQLKKFTHKEYEDEVNQKWSCQTSILMHLNPWSLLRFVWAIQKVILIKISMSIAKKNCLQEMRGWRKSERITCQTSILTHAIPWSLQKVISVTVSYSCKLLGGKFYLQGMWGWSGSERIFYKIVKSVSPWSCWDSCD